MLTRRLQMSQLIRGPNASLQTAAAQTGSRRCLATLSICGCREVSAMVRRGRHVASLESRGSTFVHSARGLWEKTWVCARRVSPPLKRVSLHHSCGLAHVSTTSAQIHMSSAHPPVPSSMFVCCLLGPSSSTFDLGARRGQCTTH